MGHWVMGQTGQQIWVGHVGYWSTRDPLNHFTLYSSGIPRDFLIHGKPATTINTYFDCLLVPFQFHNLCNSVVKDEQTTSETHRFPWEAPNYVEILGKKD